MHAPVRASGWTLLLHVALNFWFVSGLALGHSGIALSTSLSAVFNLVVLARLYPRCWGTPWTAGVWISTVRCAALSVAMGVACATVLRGMAFHARMPAAQVLILSIVIIIGVALYIGALRLLAAPEPTELFEALRSQRGAPARPSPPEGF
jgi:putative peptidoglycan lipid II flippase